MNLTPLFIAAALLPSVCRAQEAGNKQPATKEQREIIETLNSKRLALKESIRILQGKQGTTYRIIWVDYAKKLQAIDVAGCPEDFRLDWAEYIGTCKNKAGAPLKLIKAAVAAYISRNPSALIAGMDFSEEPKIAWGKLVHRAHVYHIKAANDPL
jgi:hypothetical protein